MQGLFVCVFCQIASAVSSKLCGFSLEPLCSVQNRSRITMSKQRDRRTRDNFVHLMSCVRRLKLSGWSCMRGHGHLVDVSCLEPGLLRVLRPMAGNGALSSGGLNRVVCEEFGVNSPSESIHLKCQVQEPCIFFNAGIKESDVVGCICFTLHGCFLLFVISSKCMP